MPHRRPRRRVDFVTWHTWGNSMRHTIRPKTCCGNTSKPTSIWRCWKAIRNRGYVHAHNLYFQPMPRAAGDGALGKACRSRARRCQRRTRLSFRRRNPPEERSRRKPASRGHRAERFTMVDPKEAIDRARAAVTERAELPGMSLMEHLEDLRKSPVSRSTRTTGCVVSGEML